MKLTQEELKRQLHYDPETGIFTRKTTNAPNVRIGDVADSLDPSSGYIRFRVNGTHYYAHRLAFLYMEGYFPENVLDHINRIRNDNRWCNLREVTYLCNIRNRSVRCTNTSGISGVAWRSDANKWISFIKTTEKNIHLGYFVNKADAAKARWEAEIKYDFPNCNTMSSAYLYLKENGILSEKERI